MLAYDEPAMTSESAPCVDAVLASSAATATVCSGSSGSRDSSTRSIAVGGPNLGTTMRSPTRDFPAADGTG